MGALSKYLTILAAERSTYAGIIMVIGSVTGMEMSSETASNVEQLILQIINLVGMIAVFLPDDIRKLLPHKDAS